MDWLTEHLDLVIPVVMVLLFFFRQMFAKQEGEPGDSSGLDGEARRIQEEIRRKIVARQRGDDLPPEHPHFQGESPPTTVVTPPRRPTSSRRPSPPVFLREEREESFEESPRPVQSSARNFMDELREQRERLRTAEEAKKEAIRKTRSGSAGRPPRKISVGSAPASSGTLRGHLLADLKTSDSLKRAFLLKEVLDLPAGLRERPQGFFD